MTQPFRKTFLPQNKFYSAASGASYVADEAGASAPAPTPGAPADISSSCGSTESRRAGPNGGTSERQAKASPHAGRVERPESTSGRAEKHTEAGVASGPQETAAIDSCQEPVAADLLQALGALSGTDLINEIFAVKPKHFKLKHKRRIALPRFAPDYEAMEAAMHNPCAPRAREDDPVWADEAPLFLRDAV